MRFMLMTLLCLVSLLPALAEPVPVFVHPDTVPASSWSAKWIGVGPTPGTQAKQQNLWSCYRKEFRLDRKPKTAIARIAVDSKYWLWVNGVLVVREGELKRGPTPTDTFFDEIDLAPHLKKGTNSVAILAWYFGKEGFSHKSSGKSGLLFELVAGNEKIMSDASWLTIVHPSFGDTGAPHPNYRLPESNIRFDAGKDIVGWEIPGFNATSWAPARELGSPDCAPWNRLVKRPVPFWKDYGLKPYANASSLPKVSDGKMIQAKIPYNAQITPYFKISARAGEVIKIQMDNYRGGSEPNVRAEYVTRDGEQAFECFGWMNGHEVQYEIPSGITILDLKYRETGFDTDFAGSFDCDDDFLNRLRTKAIRTLYITMRDNYMDCPDRERALWWGDAVNELGESFYAFDRRADRLTRKCIIDLVAWQKPDGVLFSPIPAGNWKNDLPLQMLASIGRSGFWTYSFFSGDMETLNVAYPGMKRYMEIWSMKPDGLVVPRPGGWAWGDWGNNVDMGMLYDAWYHIALQGLRNAAIALKKEGDLPWIEARLKSIEASFNKTYWTGTEYRSPDYKGQTDDRANALAVVAGLAKSDYYPALVEVFKKQSHSSPYMEKYVLEALCIMGQPELAQERMKKRYARMVDHPVYTTLWEGWGIGGEGFGGGTINHAWSGGPLTIMSQYFAGIAPTAAGFSSYSVLPQMGQLKKISAKVVTVKGDIALRLSNTKELFTLDLTSPAGTKATVGIPVLAGETITEVKLNGKVVWKAGKVGGTRRGARLIEANSRYLMFEVEPGTWSFCAQKKLEQTGSAPVEPAVKDRFELLPPGAIRLGGFVQQRIERQAAVDFDEKALAEMADIFRTRPGNPKTGLEGLAPGEFWGKAVRALCSHLRYSPDQNLRTRLDRTLVDLISIQSPDGCLSSMPVALQPYHGDSWDRKYVLIGLINGYEITGDPKVLASAVKMADQLLTQVGPAPKVRIVNTSFQSTPGNPGGLLRGIESSSILEPFMRLYRLTGKAEYLEFARYIVETEQCSALGPIFDEALAGKDAKDFAGGSGTAHAYSVNSCFEGLLEYYRVTGNERWMKSALAYFANVQAKEVAVIGTFCGVGPHGRACPTEEFNHSALYQTCPKRHGLEACSAPRWIALCQHMLQLTGEPRFVEEIERSLFNAVLGCIRPDGLANDYFTNLTGTRPILDGNFRRTFNGRSYTCCTYNLSEVLARVPSVAVMKGEGGVVVNLYIPGKAHIPLPSGNEVELNLVSGYPANGDVAITVTPRKKAEFPILIRIPQWSRDTKVMVNGKGLEVKPGTYLRIDRKWKSNDKISVVLDMRCRLVKSPEGSPASSDNFRALVRGPIVLARDKRLGWDIHEKVDIQADAEGYVAVTPLTPTISALMQFSVPTVGGGSFPVIDFATSGNTWDARSERVTWIPKVMRQ